jgi:hypothetical protein
MRVIDLVIVIGWVVFWAYWLIAARGVKSGRSSGWNRFIGLRVALLVVVVFAVRSWGLRGHQPGTDPVLTGTGLALFLLGLALAVWARLYIGRNWGAPMSHKDDPSPDLHGPDPRANRHRARHEPVRPDRGRRARRVLRLQRHP